MSFKQIADPSPNEYWNRAFHVLDATGYNAPAPCQYCGQDVPADGTVKNRWRICNRCEKSTPAELLNKALRRRDATDSDAHAVGIPGYARLGIGLPYENRNTGKNQRPPRSWEHVTDDIRGDWNARISHYRHSGPGKSPNGRGCGWCGIARTTTWYVFKPAQWPDGEQVHLCGHCWAIYDISRPLDPEWRWRAAAAAAGSRTIRQGDDFGWRAFFETPGQEGTTRRWDYLSTPWLEQAQVKLFGDAPQRAADPEVGRRAAQRMRQAQQDAQRQSQEHQKAIQDAHRAAKEALWT